MFYAKDLAIGQRFEVGSYTITEEEVVGFAMQYDPVLIHTNKEAAAKGPFGGLIASGGIPLSVSNEKTGYSSACVMECCGVRRSPQG